MNPKLSHTPVSDENTVLQIPVSGASLQVGKIISPAKTSKISFQKGNTEVIFTSGAGGHVDSCMIEGIEIFHPFFGDEQKPKGGMPFMFPNAGPLTPEQIKSSGLKLPQHGFGRISKWEYNAQTGEQRLVFSETPEFPFSGEVTLTMEIDDGGSVTFFQKVKNTGNTPLPLSTGLHPYFRVPQGNKDEVTWDFEGAEKVVSDREIWKNDGTGMYQVPDNKKISFFIPGLGKIELKLSQDYKKLWVWSMKDIDFVCVEPVMNDSGGIITDPVFIAPGEENINFMKISLKR